VVAGKYTGLNIYMGDINVEGNTAYAGAGNELYTFDISDVTKPVLLGSIDVTMPNSIVTYGNYCLRIPRSDRYGFDAIDISDPKNMKILETLYIGGDDYTGDMVESNGLLFSASGYIIDPGYINIGTNPGKITRDPDFIAPNISIIEPQKNANISGGMRELTVKIRTNELSSCNILIMILFMGQVLTRQR